MDPHETEQQFLALYDAQADALFRHCYYRVSDRELAKDLVQEAFTRTWDVLSGGKHIDNPKAFLFRTATNLVIDYYRKKKELSLDMLAEGGFEPGTPGDREMVAAAEYREALAAIGQLPEEYRDVLLLRYASGLSIAEIAVHNKESENAVSVRIHRATEKVRHLLQYGTL